MKYKIKRWVYKSESVKKGMSRKPTADKELRNVFKR